MYNNGFGREAALALAAALRSGLSALTALNLLKNRIGTAAAEEVPTAPPLISLISAEEVPTAPPLISLISAEEVPTAPALISLIISPHLHLSRLLCQMKKAFRCHRRLRTLCGLQPHQVIDCH